MDEQVPPNAVVDPDGVMKEYHGPPNQNEDWLNSDYAIAQARLLCTCTCTCSLQTVPSWRCDFRLLTCGICILRILLSGWSFLFMMYANCEAIAVIASTTYMTIAELFDEYPTPFSSEMMMIVIDHDTNIYIEWHNIINGNGKKHQSLWRGICPGPRPSSPPSCFLSWHGDYKTQYPYHGSSWPTITRKIQDRIQTTTSKLRNKSTFFNGMGLKLGRYGQVQIGRNSSSGCELQHVGLTRIR